MKKIIFLLMCICSASLSARLSGTRFESNNACFDTALTAGFVFKHNDCIFKEVYGRGMANAITFDSCYYPWQQWGIGAKVSYWLAHGKTTLFKKSTFLQEIPLTFYLRRRCDLNCGQLYASLGGGVVWIKETSYLGHRRHRKGIGEAEVGFTCSAWRCFDLTGAFRYLFPRQSIHHHKVDVGGFDLRAGIGYSF